MSKCKCMCHRTDLEGTPPHCCDDPGQAAALRAQLAEANEKLARVRGSLELCQSFANSTSSVPSDTATMQALLDCVVRECRAALAESAGEKT